MATAGLNFLWLPLVSRRFCLALIPLSTERSRVTFRTPTTRLNPRSDVSQATNADALPALAEPVKSAALTVIRRKSSSTLRSMQGSFLGVAMPNIIVTRICAPSAGACSAACRACFLDPWQPDRIPQARPDRRGACRRMFSCVAPSSSYEFHVADFITRIYRFGTCICHALRRPSPRRNQKGNGTYARSFAARSAILGGSATTYCREREASFAPARPSLLATRTASGAELDRQRPGFRCAMFAKDVSSLAKMNRG